MREPFTLCSALHASPTLPARSGRALRQAVAGRLDLFSGPSPEKAGGECPASPHANHTCSILLAKCLRPGCRCRSLLGGNPELCGKVPASLQPKLECLGYAQGCTNGALPACPLADWQKTPRKEVCIQPDPLPDVPRCAAVSRELGTHHASSAASMHCAC